MSLRRALGVHEVNALSSAMVAKCKIKAQRHLIMQPMGDASVDMHSCFRIARVTRPLMSVGKMCDNGLTVTFDDKCAIVKDKDGLAVCTFERASGG